jgi:hypothetical protein
MSIAGDCSLENGFAKKFRATKTLHNFVSFDQKHVRITGAEEMVEDITHIIFLRRFAGVLWDHNWELWSVFKPLFCLMHRKSFRYCRAACKFAFFHGCLCTTGKEAGLTHQKWQDLCTYLLATSQLATRPHC